MTKDHGQCVGCEDAIEWVKRQPDDGDKTYVLNRMRYEFEKDIPVKPKILKGKWQTFVSCGQCGYGLGEPQWKFCPNCGYAIKRR